MTKLGESDREKTALGKVTDGARAWLATTPASGYVHVLDGRALSVKEMLAAGGPPWLMEALGDRVLDDLWDALGLWEADGSVALDPGDGGDVVWVADWLVRRALFAAEREGRCKG